MDIQFDDTVSKRAWIKRRHSYAMRQLVKKASAIFESLLPPDASLQVAVCLYISLLNMLPLHSVLGLFMSTAIASETEQEKENALQNLALYLSALNACCYTLRVGRGRPRILALSKPWRIPCGYIHIIDLTPDELRALLAEAKQIHNTETYRKMVLELFQQEEPEITANDTKMEMSAILENTWTENKKAIKYALAMEGRSKTEIAKTLEELEKHRKAIPAYTAKSMARLYEVMPNYMHAESELRQSFARAVPELGRELFEDSELHRIGLTTADPNVRRSYLQEWKSFDIPSKGICVQTAGKVLPMHRTRMNILKTMRKFCTTRNPHNAYAKYATGKLPGTFLAESDFIPIFDELRSGCRMSDIAIRLTAKQLGIGETACLAHLKAAQPNRKINEAWINFFSKMAKQTK